MRRWDDEPLLCDIVVPYRLNEHADYVRRRGEEAVALSADQN